MALQMLLDLADDLHGLTPYNGNFGFGLYPESIYRYPRSQMYRMQHALANRLQDQQMKHEARKEMQMQNIGKDGFQVCMDVQQFKPSELSVKVLDNTIVVEGKHEEREDDHGYISRHFVRRYALPKNYDSEKVVSTLSSDGVLTVSIPKPLQEEKKNEKVIQIQQTGPAHLNIKENQQETNEKPKETGAEQKKDAKKK